MFIRSLAGLAGVAALFAGTQTAQAQSADVIRLKGITGSTYSLGSADADTELMRGGGFHGGGFRGGAVGFRGGAVGFRGGAVAFRGGAVGFRGGFVGFRGGFVGGHRGFYGGFRGFGYGLGYGYGGYGLGYGYGGYGYGGYGYGYPAYYGDYGYGYGYPGYYGCSTGVGSVYAYNQPYLASVTPYGAAQGVVPYGAQQPGINGYNGATVPQMPPVQSGDGTYPYDGGPSAPVPMPQQQLSPAPTKTAPAPPATLRLVAYPSQPVQQQPSQFAFPAYGEDNRASGFATDRTALKKTSR